MEFEGIFISLYHAQFLLFCISFAVTFQLLAQVTSERKNCDVISFIVLNDESGVGLKRSVKKLLVQTCRQAQIIIVKSPAPSVAKRIRSMFSIRPIAFVESMNEALSVSSSEYISIISESDKLNNNYLGYMLPALQKNTSLVLCPYERIKHRYSRRTFMRKEHFTSALLFDNPFASGCMFHKSFQQQHGIRFDEGLGEEKYYDFWSQFALNGAEVAFLPQPLVTLQAFNKSTHFHYSPENEHRDAIARKVQDSLNVTAPSKCDVLKRVIARSDAPSWLSDAKEYWESYCAFNEEAPVTESVIPIAMASDDNYVIPTVTAITSIMENSKRTTQYDIYILHGAALHQSGKERLSYVEKKYPNCHLIFIDMKDKFKEAPTNAKIPTESYYRLLLPNLLVCVDNIIWLDGDVLVFDDLHEMQSIDMDGYYIKGHLDNQPWAGDRYGVYNDHYICAGVLLMNLKEMRKDNISQRYLDFIEEYRDEIVQHDQTVLNVVGYNKTGVLPAKFGVFNSIPKMRYIKKYLKSLRSPQKYTISEYTEAQKSPVVAHLIAKPWLTKYPYFSTWWEYVKRTEYYEEACSRWKVTDCR